MEAERSTSTVHSGGTGMNRESVKEFSSNAARRLRESAHDVGDSLKDRTSTIISESVELVKRYPLTTALGAVAAGFIAGVIISRK